MNIDLIKMYGIVLREKVSQYSAHCRMFNPLEINELLRILVFPLELPMDSFDKFLRNKFFSLSLIPLLFVNLLFYGTLSIFRSGLIVT